MKGGERNPRAAQGQGQEEPCRGERGLSDVWGTSQKAAKGCTEPEISPPTGPRSFGGCGSASDSSPVSGGWTTSQSGLLFRGFWLFPGLLCRWHGAIRQGKPVPSGGELSRAGPAVPHLLGLRHTAGKETAGGTNSGAQKLCGKGERKRGWGLAPVEMGSLLPYSTGEESTRHRREMGTSSLVVQPLPQAGRQPPDPTAPYIAQLRVRRRGRGVMP